MPKNGLSVRFPENRFLGLDCCGAWFGLLGLDGPYCKTVFWVLSLDCCGAWFGLLGLDGPYCKTVFWVLGWDRCG